jgi:alkanesulfonate monooxygenase SsuD/methylene tetrahydromethanopterin reductase-like flavin-dependent oxidoreductase (luciferase family)
MEFGLFLNGYLPGPAAHDRDSEHTMLMREAGYVVHADKYNWKYAWFGEHHALTEYSHLSAPAPMIGYVAAKSEQIHLGTAITSFPTTKEHPVRMAERAAMLDHICEGRFEFGTGRGAGSHEVATFNGASTSDTKEMWDEVAHEIPRMWEERDYSHEGEHFSVPGQHNILPKPYGVGHPPMWLACGNPSSFAKAGSLGVGAIAFNFDPIYTMKPVLEAYKEAAESPDEILGQFQNNNIMMTNSVICLEDRDRAREIAMSAGRGYLYTMVCLYHDTMPKREGASVWPEPPMGLPDEETLDFAIEEGFMLCGNPEEVCQQLERYEDVPTDQLVFNVPNEGFTHEETIESIEVFGNQVIPNFDLDPIHSTAKMRATAKPKYQPINGPLPDFGVTVITESALLPLES